MDQFLVVCSRLAEGFVSSVFLFVLTLIIALPLGLLISFCTMSKFAPLSMLSKLVVWVLRGTPLMLQLIAYLFVPSTLSAIFGWDFYVRGATAKLILVVIAFSINYACYFSEIYRGGIQSISKGQYEAAQVLGLGKSETFFKVILLQVIKRIIPPMSNEIITLVKDTALASVIISVDLFTVAKNLVNKEVTLFPLFYAGAFYLIINGLLTVLLSKAEKKLDYFKV